MATENTATLRILGPDVGDNHVPASILIRVLGGLQEAAYLLGAASEERRIGQRFNPSEEIRERYQIRCGLPAAGSYKLPLTIGTGAGQPPLTYQMDTVPRQLFGVLSAIEADDESKLTAQLPDSRLRNLVLRRIESGLPKSGERWRLGFSLEHSQEAVIDHRGARTIARIVELAPEPDAVMTVIGELIRIDFATYRIYLRYPPTKRELECVYVPEIEVSLIDSRRDYLQVTGQYTLDDGGNPTGLTDVTRIEAVDLSPMTFESVPFGMSTLLLTSPLTVEISLDEESKQAFVAEDESINLHAFARTREELADEIAENIGFLWRTYALENPDRLTAYPETIQRAAQGRCERVSAVSG